MKNKILFPLFLMGLVFFLTGCSKTEEINTTTMLEEKQVEERSTSSVLNLDEEAATSSDRALPGQKDLYKQYKFATIVTNYGDIKVELYGDDSPITVNNFLNLAQTGFYNNTKFHRVIKDFMIQGGDPNSKDSDKSQWGFGGPNYRFDDEINDRVLVRGSLAMANAGPNTNGSQFFIVTKESTPWLDGKHTNFGRVISGMKVVQKIEDLETDSMDRPEKDAVIKQIILGEKE